MAAMATWSCSNSSGRCRSNSCNSSNNNERRLESHLRLQSRARPMRWATAKLSPGWRALQGAGLEEEERAAGRARFALRACPRSTSAAAGMSYVGPVRAASVPRRLTSRRRARKCWGCKGPCQGRLVCGGGGRRAEAGQWAAGGVPASAGAARGPVRGGRCVGVAVEGLKLGNGQQAAWW